MWSSVEAAVAAFRTGGLVIVVDDEHRENEGDLIAAAQHVTPELMAFIVRHSSGVVCTAMESARLDALHLPLMCPAGKGTQGTAFAISTDLRVGITTGISAADRAATVRALADPARTADHFTRPGHVFPLHAAPGGVLERPGHTEAGVDLAALAGLEPAAVIAEIVNDDGGMARRPDLERFALEHGLPMISVAMLVRFRRRTERLLTRGAETTLPTRHGEFRACSFLAAGEGGEHLALVRGEVRGGDDVVVRVHSECLTGDVFGSLRCDCGDQLDTALWKIARAGRGVLVYLRGHEGRGIGEYFLAAQILTDLGVGSVRLLTNNADKIAQLTDHGITVAGREEIRIEPGPHTLTDLRTKRDRLGHQLGALPTDPIRSTSAAECYAGLL